MGFKQMRAALNPGRWQLPGSFQAPGSFSRANRRYATHGRPLAYTWLTKTAEETVSKTHISALLKFKLNNKRPQMIFCLVFLQGL